MNATAWEQVKTIFHRALGQPREQRSGFVGAASPDAEVLAEVRRLLREHEEAGSGFLPPGGVLRDQRIGTLLGGRYLIEGELGRGGNSIVYLAQDRQMHGKKVVVKMLQDHLARNQWLCGKFRHEVEALARISHPGVVSALDVVAGEDGRDCLVMEFVAGTTLRAELGQGSLELPRLAELLPKVGDALQAAHEHGVLHRDLKPENIMLLPPRGGEESIKLIDFGIAKLEDPHDAECTDTTVLAGTTTYMAPEHLMGKPQTASDIYALAVVAYEVIAGKRPFYPATPFQLFEMQKTGTFPDLAALRPEIGARASLLIRKSLSFRPADRHSSALEFCNELAAALRDPGMPVKRDVSRRSALAAGAGLVLAGCGGVLIWQRSFSEDPVRPIEFRGGQPDHQLKRHRDITALSEYNVAKTGFDTTRLMTQTQGYFWWQLNRGQQRYAFRRGWRITLEGESVRGIVFADILFSAFNRRWDLTLARKGSGGQTVFLTTSVGQNISGIEYEVPGPPGVAHVYTLAAGPSSPSVTLTVDGKECVRDYEGYSDYVEDRGFIVGQSSYLSANGGEGIVRRARFEAA
ncbi:MAG: serine/threonine-protein kinase [Candidatus Solibacter sp.]